MPDAAGRLSPIGPSQAATLAGATTLFIATLLADWAYWSSAQIQWSDFASWLLVGALVLGAWVLLCGLAGLRERRRRDMTGLLLWAVAWVLGVWDALVHARDAWATMPMALVLSAVVAVLACIATWRGFSPMRAVGTP